MGEVRIKDGDLEIRITDNLDAWVDNEYLRASRAMAAGGVEVLSPVAEAARREWYGPNGVNRDTGRSGDVVVTETIDVRGNEVRVAVGSTDTVMVKGSDGRSRPRATAIHRPGALAMEWQKVSDSEYWRMYRQNEKLGRTVYKIRHDKKTGEHWAKKQTDRSSDGAYLLQVYIMKPSRAAIKGLARAVGWQMGVATFGGE